jgi:gamma-polyglutamate biosynthesis protein CapA
MKRKLNFKEKLLIFIKQTKYKNLQYALFVTPTLITLLILTTWLGKVMEVDAVTSQIGQSGQKITMTMVGDVMLGRYVENVINQHGPKYLFRYVKPYFDQSDYVSGNFETPVLKHDVSKYTVVDKKVHLYTNEKAVQAVKNTGFTIMNLANNHMMDFEEKGLNDTIDSFRGSKMDYVGAGKNFNEAKNHINYKDINGVRVATLGFTDIHLPGSITIIGKGGILSANPDTLFEMIEKAKNPLYGNADLVVVNVHWGEEYDSEASPRQKELAKAMVNAGADIIVGHHPHVLQSFDVYKQGIIFYSLGNFVFDQGWTRTKDSVMVQYSLAESGKATINVVPLHIQEATPKPVTSYLNKEKIYRQLTKETSENVHWTKRKDKLVIILNHKSVLDHMKKREQKENEINNEGVMNCPSVLCGD